MKNYIGFSLDMSGSMRHIAHAAMADFNEQVRTIKGAATEHNQDTIVSVVTMGVGSEGVVGRSIVNSPITVLQPLTQYVADARATPMIDSVFELIKIMESAPDAADPNVSFLIMVTTDGEENVSRRRGRELAQKINELQRTDRWTFVFRVPRNGTRELAELGITNVNIFEWDQTVKGVQQSTQANTEAFTEYFRGRSAGMKSTRKFYASMADVDIKDVQAQLTDISSEVTFLPVTSADDQALIRPFVEMKLNEAMVRGGAFYQLVKTEPKVQANKRIAIRDKKSGAVYAGDAARHMLALPTIGTVRLAPDELGDYEVFIQSTSVNRKLDAGTQLMYWKGVGKAFKEGPSAR